MDELHFTWETDKRETQDVLQPEDDLNFRGHSNMVSRGKVGLPILILIYGGMGDVTALVLVLLDR